MDNTLMKSCSARLPIRAPQSMAGVLVLATSALAVLALLVSAGALLLSAVTVPGVVLGVLGVLGAKSLVSFWAGLIRRIYEGGVVDASAVFRAVDRWVAPALGREAGEHATSFKLATAKGPAVPAVSTVPAVSPASTISRSSTPPTAPTVASRMRELATPRAVTETEQRVA